MLPVNGVVERKLALLDKHLTELQKNMKNVSFDNFKDNYVLKCMAERSLQVMIEIMIDVAERIIALKHSGPVENSSQAIKKLAELGAVKSENPYINMIRFRNLIVHQYNEIDPKFTFHIINNELDAFKRFRDEIDNYEN